MRPPAPRQPAAIVTTILIGLNVAVFLLMLAKGISPTAPTNTQLVRWGANFGPLTLHGQWWRLATACFLHIGIAHIGMNMYSLYQVGRPVELVFGRARYLLLYAVAGLGGDLASLYVHPGTVSAGASGAIFGVFGALIAFVLVRRKEMNRRAVDSILRSAGYVLVVNLVIGFTVKEIDLSGHIGGIVTGFLAGCVLARRNADGSMRLPLARGLSIVAVALVLAVVSLKALASRMPGNDAFYKVVFTAPSVPLGDGGALYYTGSASPAQAQSLARALAGLGLESSDLDVVWTRIPGSTTLLFALPGDEAKYARTPEEAAAGKRVAPWNSPRFLQSFQVLGQAVKALAGGEPYTIILADENGEPHKMLHID